MKNIADIFNERTCYKFSNKPIDIDLLRQIYDLMKLGPTSGNGFPLRIMFVQSLQEKERLEKCFAEGNVAKVHSAPVVALFAYDSKFVTKMDSLNPMMKSYFESLGVEILDNIALNNSSLQAAYFMMIARGFGLDCGPMAGFDAKKLEEEFLQDTNWRINFTCNLGYKDGDNAYPRLPRLDFDQACLIK
jgi:3-hydroxypropanoate dehydrogenase